MKQRRVKGKTITGMLMLLVTTIAQAGIPLWSFTPGTGSSSPKQTISSTGTTTVQYTVTNNSSKPHNLVIQPQTGISHASSCILGPRGSVNSSCLLSLTITGSALPAGGITGGPVLCQANPNGTPNPNQCYQPSSSDILVITVESAGSYTVTASGDAHVTVTSTNPQMVSYGSTTTFTVSPTTGYTVVGSGCGGSLAGNTYTTGPITSTCSVSFSSVAIFPAAAGPSNVMAVPGDGQVTVNWTAPTNTGAGGGGGGGTISGYKVTYGPTSGTVFTTAGCSPVGTGTSCTVPSLTNGTAYTFAVCTTTTLSGANETGPVTYSSSVTPRLGVVISPSSLALSVSDAGTYPALTGSPRTITLTNNSAAAVTISAAPTTADISPAIGTGPTQTTVSATTCTTGLSLPANNGSCTVTITPGSVVSSNNAPSPCTTGVMPTASTLSITTSAGPITGDIYVLGYGCIYQSGYLFSVDDDTPLTGSIGGTVVAQADQAAAPQIFWSPGGAHDSIWGIDETSSTSTPSPNAGSAAPVTLQLGQLNCVGNSDGACDSNNIILYYGVSTGYAAGICAHPFDGTGYTTCSGGSSCYTDWYLPSICEMGYDSQSLGSGCGTQLNPTLQNIQSNLIDSSVTSSPTGYYWSSTEFSFNPQSVAWYEYFASGGGSDQNVGYKTVRFGVRCSRALTL